jgi:hypothetical protein
MNTDETRIKTEVRNQGTEVKRFFLSPLPFLIRVSSVLISGYLCLFDHGRKSARAKRKTAANTRARVARAE